MAKKKKVPMVLSCKLLLEVNNYHYVQAITLTPQLFQLTYTYIINIGLFLATLPLRDSIELAKMALFLLKLIFFAVSLISNLVSRLIFSTIAHLLVLLIQGFKLPGQAIHGALGQVSEVIKSCFEYFLGLVMEAISTLISSFFDYLIESVTGSASVTTSTIGDLLEKTKTSLDALTDFEVFEGVPEMIFNMAMDLWNNYVDALGYVAENA